MIALEDKPEAYLVPTLIDLRGKRHSVPLEAVDLVQGTVAWRPEYLVDGQGHGVTDKNGITHYPIPLYRAAKSDR